MNQVKFSKGVTFTIMDVLDCVPKEYSFRDIGIGRYFDYQGVIFLKLSKSEGKCGNGTVTFTGQDMVRPLDVEIICDYELVKKGEENHA